jgi:hypothetical protein
MWWESRYCRSHPAGEGGNGSFSIVNRMNDMAASEGFGASANDSVSLFAYFGRDRQKWHIGKVR